MKWRLIPGAILTLLAGVAHADDLSGNSVELYGTLDVAIGTVEHSANGSGLEAITIDPERVAVANYNRLPAVLTEGFQIRAGAFVEPKTSEAGRIHSSTWSRVSVCNQARSIMRLPPLPARTIRRP